MTKGSVFIYEKKPWIVLREGIYRGYYVCLSPDNTTKQISEDVIRRSNHYVNG